MPQTTRFRRAQVTLVFEILDEQGQVINEQAVGGPNGEPIAVYAAQWPHGIDIAKITARLNKQLQAQQDDGDGGSGDDSKSLPETEDTTNGKTLQAVTTPE